MKSVILDIKNEQGILKDIAIKYDLQIVLEDSGKYYIEDMKHKRSMTRGYIVAIAENKHLLNNYLKLYDKVNCKLL